jgi:hypothetical protein
MTKGKIVYRPTYYVQEYECAFCYNTCSYDGIAYCKWGQVELWKCKEHGWFGIMAGPMSVKGDQIR